MNGSGSIIYIYIYLCTCAPALNVSVSKSWCVPVSDYKSRYFPKLWTVMPHRVVCLEGFGSLQRPLGSPHDDACECVILGHDP